MAVLPGDGGDAWSQSLTPLLNATTFGGMHAAVLLQASGRSTSLRSLLRVEQERGFDFLCLVNALTARIHGAATQSSCWTQCRSRFPNLEATTFEGDSLPARLELMERITVRQDVFGGKPIIRDLRITVEHVLGMLAAGDTAETILHEYAFLEPEDIQACLFYAHRSIAGEDVHDRVLVSGS